MPTSTAGCGYEEKLQAIAEIGEWLATPDGAKNVITFSSHPEGEKRAKLRTQRFAQQRAMRPIFAAVAPSKTGGLSPMSKCGWTRVMREGGVQLHVHDNGRASLRGIASCKRRTCPGCGPRLLARDAELVEAGVKEHGYERTLMLTLTVRHWREHPLLAMRKGVVASWIDMQRQRAYKSICKTYGAHVFVRVVEVTHRNANGWHVHYHALVFVEQALSTAHVQSLQTALGHLWRRSVVRVMGAAHRPSKAHGVLLTPCHKANYLTKLGLEVTDASRSKKGKRGSRSYWRIGVEWLEAGADVRAADASKLATFIRDMRGCVVVAWPTRGEYRRAALDERHPEEKPAIRESTVLNEVEWDGVRKLELDGEDGRVVVLRAAERAHPGELAQAVDEAVTTLLQDGEPPPLRPRGLASCTPPEPPRAGYAAG